MAAFADPMPLIFISSEGERAKSSWSDSYRSKSCLATSMAVLFLVPFPINIPRSSASVRESAPC